MAELEVPNYHIEITVIKNAFGHVVAASIVVTVVPNTGK